MREEKDLAGLFEKLRRLHGMGRIGGETYRLGVHVLQRMAAHKSLEIGASWGEFTSQSVVAGDEVLAPPISGEHYLFYGAIKQLQEVVGVFSHLTCDGLEEDMREAQEGDGVCPHFISTPGVDSHVIGARTLLVFAYREWAGVDVRGASEEFFEEGVTKRLPQWLYKARNKRKESTDCQLSMSRSRTGQSRRN